MTMIDHHKPHRVPMPVPLSPVAARMLCDGRPAVLARIAEPGIGAAIWARENPPALYDWIEALPPDRLPRLRHLLAVDQVDSAMRAACVIARTPPCPEREMLIADVAMLAARFATLMGEDLVQLRLAVIDNDACRRFHVDRVRARLLCSYRGPGTVLSAGDGAGLPHGPETPLARGTVAVLRGTLWPGCAVTTLLHRSPPMQGTGRVRLLLAIDPPPEDCA